MTAKHSYLAVLLVVLLSASGCVTAPLAVDGSEAIGPDEGLLAVRFVSDWKGNESMIFDAISFSVHPQGGSVSEVLEMRSNDDAQLVALPAGKYSFVRFSIGSGYRLFDDDWFTIKAGEITYVGDMTMLILDEAFAVKELRVDDNQQETMARLRAMYGALIENYPVTVQIINPTISEDRY